MTPAPLRPFLKKINSGSTPICEIRYDSGLSPLRHSASCTLPPSSAASAYIEMLKMRDKLLGG